MPSANNGNKRSRDFSSHEGLVLDLPPQPHAAISATLCRLTGRMVTQTLEYFVAVESLESDPVDNGGVLAVAQWNAGDPPITPDLNRLATLSASAP